MKTRHSCTSKKSILVFLLSVCPISCFAQEWTSELHQKIQREWDLALRKTLEGDFAFTITNSVGKTDETKGANFVPASSETIFVSIGKGIQTAESQKKNGADYFSGMNPDYRFELERKNNADWTLVSVQGNIGLKEDYYTVGGACLKSTSCFLNGLRIERVKISELFKHSSFRVISCQTRNDPIYGPLLEITFAAQLVFNEYDSILGGRVSLMERHHYLVREYEIEMPWDQKVKAIAKGINSYQNFNGAMLIDTSSFKGLVKNETKLHRVHSISGLHVLNSPLVKPQLSNFGFNEPPGLGATEYSTGRKVIWLFLPAAALIGILFYLKNRK